MRNKNKKKDYTCEDLRVDRGAIASISMPNEENPSIMEISVSLFAIPKEQCDMDIYEEKVNRIVSYSNKLLRGYVRANSGVFDNKCIVDINFTTANLKKGYNKSVQMSMFVRKMVGVNGKRLILMMKDGIRPVVNSITSKIVEEGFSCHKRRQAINAKK